MHRTERANMSLSAIAATHQATGNLLGVEAVPRPQCIQRELHERQTADLRLTRASCTYTEAVAILRPEDGRHLFPVSRPRPKPGQANATFQWQRFLAGRAPPRHAVVVINMDETSMRIWPALWAAASPKLPTATRWPASSSAFH